MPYLPTFTIKINQMLVDIPYMDPMGYIDISEVRKLSFSKNTFFITSSTTPINSYYDMLDNRYSMFPSQ